MRSLRKYLKRNLIWLKWPVLCLSICLVISVALIASASHYRGEAKKGETLFIDEYNWLTDQIARMELSQQIISEHAGKYRQLVASSIIGHENRVALLEGIRVIRERHNLFPLEVEIKEQDRIVIPYPDELEEVDEQLSLRGSLVQIKIPMLHEYDLTRFLNDFLNRDRLLFTNSCTVTEANLSEEDLMDIVEHQVAVCEFYWLTLQREPFNPDEHFY